ncbi:MAG: cytochrome c oxidase subunit 3 [Hyphomicrobiales bacterium]
MSEIMFFFFAFFWVFFASSISPVFNIGGVWPPVGIYAISPWHPCGALLSLYIQCLAPKIAIPFRVDLSDTSAISFSPEVSAFHQVQRGLNLVEYVLQLPSEIIVDQTQNRPVLSVVSRQSTRSLIKFF